MNDIENGGNRYALLTEPVPTKELAEKHQCIMRLP